MVTSLPGRTLYWEEGTKTNNSDQRIYPAEVMVDHEQQLSLLEKDLESICIMKASYLIMILGDFNHKLDLSLSDKMFKDLLAIAQIPQANFVGVGSSSRDKYLVKFLGSIGLFCANGWMNSDGPARKTFCIGNQNCPIHYAFINAWYFKDVERFEVLQSEGSDHWPLQLVITISN